MEQRRMDARESGQEDERLVSAFRAGQAQAFERLVDKYFGTVYSICFAHVREREQAEELAQEVVLRMYLHMGSLKSGRVLAAWVGGIARNLSRDWLRRGQTRSRLLPLVALEQLPGDL